MVNNGIPPSHSTDSIVESLFSISSCDVPVQASKISEWEVVSDPNRLMKRYAIPSYQMLIHFVNEILQYQDEVQHHAKIIVDPDEVIIEVYTHDINDITEIDKEFAVMADQIFVDVSHYNTGDSNEQY